MITLDPQKNLLKKTVTMKLMFVCRLKIDNKFHTLIMTFSLMTLNLHLLLGVASKFVKTRSLTFFSQYSLLIPLGISENLWFSDVSRGIKREHWEERV